MICGHEWRVFEYGPNKSSWLLYRMLVVCQTPFKSFTVSPHYNPSQAKTLGARDRINNLPKACRQGGGRAEIHDFQHHPWLPQPRTSDAVGSHFYLKGCLPEMLSECFGPDKATVKIPLCDLSCHLLTSQLFTEWQLCVRLFAKFCGFGCEQNRVCSHGGKYIMQGAEYYEGNEHGVRQRVIQGDGATVGQGRPFRWGGI